MSKHWLIGALLGSALAAAAAPGNMIGQMTQNEGITATPAPGAVKIDGSLEDWDLSGQIWSFADYAVRDQFSVRTAAMWDAEALYLSFVWKDPTPMFSTVNPAFDASRGWVADAIQLRMIAGGNPLWITGWCYNRNQPVLDFLYWKSATDHREGGESKLYPGAPGKTELGDGIESAYAELPDGSGFIHELKLPWRVLSRSDWQPKAGDTLKMGVEFMWGSETGDTWPSHRFADNMMPGVTSRQFFWSARNAWGPLELGSGPVKTPRTYELTAYRPQGTIPVTAEIPADARSFTLVIEDAQGNRIRNLAGELPPESFTLGEVQGDKRTIQVQWNGLDDRGRLVAPGTYRVRGLTHRGLNARYVMSFYNPGTPPWSTPDGKGGWGSDHSRPEFLARSGDDIIVACGFVEGGHGIWALGPDGKKRWSEKRGVSAMTANDRYVYSVPNFWDTTESTLYRYDARTGKYAPFVKDGKARPFNLSFREILKLETAPEVLTLAAGPKSLLAALGDGSLAEIDAETGDLLRKFQTDFDRLILPKAATLNSLLLDKILVPLAFDGETCWFFHDGKLTALTTADGRSRIVPLTAPVEKPTAIALDREGNLYLADQGKDMQIKKFSRDGKFLGSYGRRGGRPRQGVYQAQGMREMAAVAVGADGRVWTTEYSDFPRRVSAWRPDGSLDREYVGNTGYSGTGAILHDSDPGRAFLGANELKLDLEHHTWEMAAVLWNPPPEVDAFQLQPSHAAGHVFRSSASGKEHEYYFTPYALYLNDNGNWRPVFGINLVGSQQKLLKNNRTMAAEAHGALAGLNPFDTIIWNDGNRDGLIQREEFEVIPAKKPAAMGEAGIPGIQFFLLPWGQRMDPADLSFYLLARDGKRWKVVPERFGADGAPVYTLKALKPFADLTMAEACDMVPVPGEDTVITFTRVGRNSGEVQGLDKKTGAIRWSYPDPYNSVHGSHRAVMPRPGLLIGPLKVTGIVPDCGEAGNVFMLRGNLGQDFYFTTDGLYIASMFRDGRLPGPGLPATEEALRSMPFTLITMGGEPFNGWLGRQRDGVVRMLCGIAGNAASLAEVEGFDSIRRFTGPQLTVTAADLVKADQANIAAARSEKVAPAPLVIARCSGNRPDWNRIKPIKLEREGQPVTADCRLAANDRELFFRFIIQDPSPWRNGGRDLTRLFKTGDCVDLQLSPSGNTGREAAEGDLRLVIAPQDGKTVAVLMRPKWSKAEQAEFTRYQSPVGVVEFQQVKLLPEVKTTVRTDTGKVTVEGSVPWSALGVNPQPGSKLRGDVGIILSDEAGTINTARIYYANQETNLVNDLPMEAKLQPDQWVELELAK